MDTRASILNAALTLFANYGYDAVGVQAIVEAAQVTKPTLYHYFGSKQGLFETLVRERSAAWIEALRESTAYHGDIKNAIVATVRTCFEHYEDDPVFYRMVLSMWFAPPSSEYFGVVHDLLQEQHALFAVMFQSAERQHGNMRGRSVQYAISLRGLIDTYIGMAIQGYVDLKDEAMLYRVVHQFMHGIFS